MRFDALTLVCRDDDFAVGQGGPGAGGRDVDRAVDGDRGRGLAARVDQAGLVQVLALEVVAGAVLNPGVGGDDVPPLLVGPGMAAGVPSLETEIRL